MHPRPSPSQQPVQISVVKSPASRLVRFCGVRPGSEKQSKGDLAPVGPGAIPACSAGVYKVSGLFGSAAVVSAIFARCSAVWGAVRLVASSGGYRPVVGQEYPNHWVLSWSGSPRVCSKTGEAGMAFPAGICTSEAVSLVPRLSRVASKKPLHLQENMPGRGQSPFSSAGQTWSCASYS